MKFRVALSALLVASLFGFAFSWSVLAAGCPSIDNESDKEVHQCSSSYVVDAAVPMGGFLWVTPVKSYTTLPNPPRVDFLGPAVTLSVVDSSGMAVSSVHMELCLSDTSSTGNVFMWSGAGPLYSATPVGMWVYVPTYHLSGWDCAAAAARFRRAPGRTPA